MHLFTTKIRVDGRKKHLPDNLSVSFGTNNSHSPDNVRDGRKRMKDQTPLPCMMLCTGPEVVVAEAPVPSEGL
jgi:hypothetical protein